MGFVLGVAIGIIVYSLYRDIKKMRVWIWNYKIE
jgi:hypothetical protein